MSVSPGAPPEEPRATVRVRLFASLREEAGWSERLITVPAAEATPRALWRQLHLHGVSSADAIAPGASAMAAPAGPAAGTGADSGWPEGIRVAINQVFAAVDTPLANGDELAFLPPISGG